MIPWTIPQQVKKAISILKNNQETAFLVGGAVRDFLLGKEPKDWDLVTSASLLKIKELFPKNFLSGKKQETINILLDNFSLEISSYRGGSNTLEEDLAKRDFTINAIVYDYENRKIIDPFLGTEDLKKGLIQGVENPRERFREDPLRMLRAVRIMAEYGFHLNSSTELAIRSEGYLLRQVSIERIRDELAKILLTERVTLGITKIEELGLLSIFLPELSKCFGIEQNAFHHLDVAGHILKVIENLPQDNLELRVIGLLHDLGKPKTRSVGEDGRVHFYGHENYSADIAKKVLDRLKITTRLLNYPLNAKRVVLLVKNHMFFYREDTSDKAVRRLLSRLGPENVEYFLTLQRADILAGSPAKQKRLPDVSRLEANMKRILAGNPPLLEKELALTGQEIMDYLQLPPGKDVGKIKKRLFEAVIDNPELNNQADLKSMLKEGKSTRI